MNLTAEDHLAEPSESPQIKKKWKKKKKKKIIAIEENQEETQQEQTNHKGTSPIRSQTPPQDEEFYPLPESQNPSRRSLIPQKRNYIPDGATVDNMETANERLKNELIALISALEQQLNKLWDEKLRQRENYGTKFGEDDEEL